MKKRYILFGYQIQMVSSVLFNKKAPPSSIFLMLTAMVTVSSRLPHT